MWRNDRDRPDDPRTQARETQRLARDEYDRPRYGSTPADFGERSRAEPWPAGDRPRDQPFAPRGEAARWDSFAQGQPPQQGGRPYEPSGGPHEYRPEEHRLNDIRVHELMTRRVSSVHPATSVERAARLLEECDCGALPVIGDNGVLVGIVTDRDIVIRIVARGRDVRNAIVADCMSERVFACYANETVTECMREMARHQVRRVPIVDDRGRVVGMVAQGDLARHALHRPVRDEREAVADVVGAVSQPPHVPYR